MSRLPLLLCAAAATASASSGDLHWCVSPSEFKAPGFEHRGTFRDFSLYLTAAEGAAKGAAPRCEAIWPHKHGSDGLWVLEFTSETRFEKALSALHKAGLAVPYRAPGGVMSVVATGGEALPAHTNLDACGGQVGTAVIPVPSAAVVYPPRAAAAALVRARGGAPVDARIAAAVASVTEAGVTKTVATMQEWPTRNSRSETVREATAWLEAQYLRLGFTVSRHTFQEGMAPTVVAELRGAVHPEKIIVVGAHYDSRSTDVDSATQRAPGADDNASGTSALLEVARAVREKGLRLEYTLRLCSFAGEEQGLLGSRALAEKWRAEGLKIEAMFNADMLGFRIPGQPVSLGFKDRYVSTELTEAVRALVPKYVPGLPTGYSSSCCSDYMGFHENGYLAVGFFENLEGASSYPHYHTSTDLLEYVDTAQLTLQVRAVLATVLTYTGVAGAAPVPEVMPAGDTFVYIAPADTPEGAAVPGSNMTVVGTDALLRPVPEGWRHVPLPAATPKYLLKSHHAEDRRKLAAAYGADLARVTDEFFVLATDEVGEPVKAHGCGKLRVAPVANAARRSSVKPPQVRTQEGADKAAYMALITEGGVREILQQLSGEVPIRFDGREAPLATRYSFVDENLRAGGWIAQWMLEHAGVDQCNMMEFTASGNLTRNIVCERLGSEEPDSIVVLGAHFDSISSSNGGDSAKFAPGAIDNGSGTTNVMAAAKALKDFKPKKTIHFILFSGEEQGLLGSTHYVDVQMKRKAKIDAALIMDMTGYSSKYFGVIAEGSHDPGIKALMVNAEANLNYLKANLGSAMTFQHNHKSFGSDHVPFQRAGIPAILLIERDDTDYPGYHKTTDQAKTYANYAQMRDIARVIMGQVVDYSDTLSCSL